MDESEQTVADETEKAVEEMERRWKWRDEERACGGDGRKDLAMASP